MRELIAAELATDGPTGAAGRIARAAGLTVCLAGQMPRFAACGAGAVAVSTRWPPGLLCRAVPPGAELTARRGPPVVKRTGSARATGVSAGATGTTDVTTVIGPASVCVTSDPSSPPPSAGAIGTTEVTTVVGPARVCVTSDQDTPRPVAGAIVTTAAFTIHVGTAEPSPTIEEGDSGNSRDCSSTGDMGTDPASLLDATRSNAVVGTV